MKAALVAILGAAALVAGIACAHQTRISSSRLEIEGTSVRATLELNGTDLNVAARLALTGERGAVEPQRLAAQRDVVLAYVHTHVTLALASGTRCEVAREALQPRGDHVIVHVRFRCPSAGRPLEYRVTLFHEIDPAAKHVVTAVGAEPQLGLLSAANPRVRLSDAHTGPGETLRRYVVAGIEHIAIGYDHIAFLLAVLALGRRFWPLFAAVTAFTVAHSITLSLAVLGWVVVPARIVEPLIALTIVYVAAENFFVRDIRRRWWRTFAFGLIHGFGFASVLREYGVPENALLPALAGFNIGVEVGQLAVVVLAVIAWRAAFALSARAGMPDGPPAQRRVALTLSAGVLLLGTYWLGERLLA